jgi:hypothetical protein
VKGLAIAFCVAAGAAFAGCADGDDAQSSRDQAYEAERKPGQKGKPDEGDFVLELRQPRGDDGDAHALIKDQDPKILVEGLNENFRLPRDIKIIFETGQNDDDTSPYYDPDDGNIHVPYEFFYETIGVFLETGDGEDAAVDNAVDALEFVIYHEVAHALIDALRIPVTGREEDAADGLATAILTLAVEQGPGTVLTAADWFYALSELGGDTIGADQFADVHSLDDQRFYSLVCWVYGSNPDRYVRLIKRGDLPKSRAVGCVDEYLQNVESWIELLDPWLNE